jgi:hypothetical protein
LFQDGLADARAIPHLPGMKKSQRILDIESLCLSLSPEWSTHIQNKIRTIRSIWKKSSPISALEFTPPFYSIPSLLLCTKSIDQSTVLKNDVNLFSFNAGFISSAYAGGHTLGRGGMRNFG